MSVGRIFDLGSSRLDDDSDRSKLPALLLLEYLVRKEARGVLEIISESATISIWLHHGNSAYAISKPVDEASALGRILINMKRLNETGLREGLASAKANKKALGRALIGLGLIKKSDLTAALREQARLILERALHFKTGTYQWSGWREPPGHADLVVTKGLGLIARHLRGRYDALGSSELEVLFGRNLGRKVAPNREVDRLAGTLGLQPKELRFVKLQMDGSRPINDAVLGSPIGRLASLRLVGMMLSLGFLSFTDGPQRVVREKTVASREPSAFVRLKKTSKSGWTSSKA